MQQQEMGSKIRSSSLCTPLKEKYTRQEQKRRSRQQERMEHILNYELDEGEALLWSGRPNALHVTPGEWVAGIIGGGWMFLVFLYPMKLYEL